MNCVKDLSYGSCHHILLEDMNTYSISVKFITHLLMDDKRRIDWVL